MDKENPLSINTIGATNLSKGEREPNDYYATDPRAVKMLLELETFAPKVWECACGQGHIAKVLQENGHEVLATDLINRGFGEVEDFLQSDRKFNGDIVTNPPYKYAIEFCTKALDSIPTGNKVAMFLRLQFLEGKSRRKFFEENPPKTVYVSSSRLRCGKNGVFPKDGNAVAYAWFVWEKGFKGKPQIEWFN